MVAKLRLISALCAFVAAVIVVWQTNPAGPARVDAADIPMTNVTTSIKWPVIETVDPDPFARAGTSPSTSSSGSGLAVTPPDARGGPAVQVRRRELSGDRRGVRLADI